MGVRERLFALAVLLKSNDILTTTIAVMLQGPAVEANPLVRYSIIHMGLAPAMLLNFISFYLMLLSMFRRKVYYFIGVNALLTFVIVNNVINLMYF